MALNAERFWRIASPIMQSVAFKRLRNVTFLGILSPAYNKTKDFPFLCKEDNRRVDQTRAHHSFAVALLAGRIAEEIGLSEEIVDHAIAWGLLHDIATWPLSHTGEAAFSLTTGVDSHELRRWMITGAHKLASRFSLYNSLLGTQIDIEKLIALFEKTVESNLSFDFQILHKVLHSTINPDTLEGMYRSGRAFNVAIPKPKIFVTALDRDLADGVCLKKDYSQDAFLFWRGKSSIYNRYINRRSTIKFETLWSKSIVERYSSMHLNDSLDLDEKQLVKGALTAYVGVRDGDVLRYKEPLTYGFAHKYERQRSFKHAVSLDALSYLFVKEPIKSPRKTDAKDF